MELIYLWVRNYKNVLKDIGINFTTEYEINVSNTDENLQVKIQNKKSHKLMGENLEFFGIIGENGVGKSSILKCIIGQDFNGFSMYKIGSNEFKIFRNEKFKITFDGYCVEESSNGNNDYAEYLIYKENYSSGKNSKFNLIYYDNIFNIKEIYKGRLQSFAKNYNYNDISISHQLYHINKGNIQNQNINDIENVIWYFYKTRNDNLKIGNPKTLYIKHNLNKNIIHKHNDFCSYVTFEDALIKNFVYNFLDEFSLLENDKSLGTYEKLFLPLFEVFKNGSKIDVKEYINKNFVYKTNGRDKDNDRVIIFDIQMQKIDKYIEIINIVKTFNEKNFIKLNGLNKSEIHMDIKFNDEEILYFLSFLEKCREYDIDISFFEFYYDKVFSSGEVAIVSIFSKVYKALRDIQEGNNNVLILMDEPDIFLHPEWQRRFIHNLNNFLGKIRKIKKIKVILTSHSPFIASDLPKENVIMLEKSKDGKCVVKDNKIDTFGANIFDLYSKAFFVESSFGEFAKEKIKEVVKKIEENKYYENKEEIDFIVNSIGEPLIKNKLLNMIKENQSKEDRISELEQELAKLRGDK